VKRSKVILYFAIVAAIFSLVFELLLNQAYVRILIPLLIGGLWVFMITQKRAWGPALCAFGLLLFVSILQDISEIWLNICLLACVIAWDLSYFVLDLQQSEHVRQKTRIENEHLIRLSMIVGLSCVILLVSRWVRVDLGFEWVLFLGLALIIGFSRVIIMIRESTSTE
jgi:hypothetical protein